MRSCISVFRQNLQRQIAQGNEPEGKRVEETVRSVRRSERGGVDEFSEADQGFAERSLGEVYPAADVVPNSVLNSKLSCVLLKRFEQCCRVLTALCGVLGDRRSATSMTLASFSGRKRTMRDTKSSNSSSRNFPASPWRRRGQSSSRGRAECLSHFAPSVIDNRAVLPF